MTMFRSIMKVLVLTLHLMGCAGIGGIWLDPSNAPLSPSYPYGARWVKEEMTRESRRADWMACGGGADFRYGFRGVEGP